MKGYQTGSYWARRQDMLYYQYFRYMVRCLAAEASSMLDVGSGNAPYLEWFDWIPRRVSVDRRIPYRSQTVQGICGDIREIDFGAPFDLCTCLQVLEHVPEPESFARRLLELGRLLLISVPHNWPKGHSKHHVNDPVDLAKLTAWFGRGPNYHIAVHEPFHGKKGARLFALFDPAAPDRRFGSATARRRRPL